MRKGPSPRPSVAFVGAFNTTGSTLRGGQISACDALLKSSLSERFRFHLIDSTQESVPPPPLGRRAILAARRVAHFSLRMLTRKDHIALIFISDGFGFIEKGLMVLLGRVCGRRIVLAPRSGILIDDYAKGRLWRSYIRTVLRAAHVVVCQSASWRAIFASWGVPEEQLLIVRNWIDASQFAAIPPPEPARSGELHALFLGHVERAKGIFDLIDAVAQVRRHATVRLTIAGNGGALEAARQRVSELGIDDRVRFAGWVDEAGRLAELAAADVLVLPSYREGMPNVVLEAMAAARPAIATRVGGIPELIEHGSSGLLFEAGDVSSLAAFLEELVAHPGQVTAMGTEARRRVLRYHDVEAGSQAMMYALIGR